MQDLNMNYHREFYLVPADTVADSVIVDADTPHGVLMDRVNGQLYPFTISLSLPSGNHIDHLRVEQSEYTLTVYDTLGFPMQFKQSTDIDGDDIPTDALYIIELHVPSVTFYSVG